MLSSHMWSESSDRFYYSFWSNLQKFWIVLQVSTIFFRVLKCNLDHSTLKTRLATKKRLLVKEKFSCFCRHFRPKSSLCFCEHTLEQSNRTLPRSKLAKLAQHASENWSLSVFEFWTVFRSVCSTEISLNCQSKHQTIVESGDNSFAAVL